MISSHAMTPGHAGRIGGQERASSLSKLPLNLLLRYVLHLCLPLHVTLLTSDDAGQVVGIAPDSTGLMAVSVICEELRWFYISHNPALWERLHYHFYQTFYGDALGRLHLALMAFRDCLNIDGRQCRSS